MPDRSRAGTGHLAALMHRALQRGDAAALAALRAECARRPAADQEAYRREWLRQCSLRRRAGPALRPHKTTRGEAGGGAAGRTPPTARPTTACKAPPPPKAQRLGLPTATLAAVVGHERPMTTLRHYTAPTKAEVAEAASRVSDRIAGRG